MTCYKCRATLPESANVCPACGQAVYTRHTGPALSMGRRIDGGLPSEPSPKDYVATPNLPSLPRKVDLRAHCSPVEDQGQIGSCIPCAVVGALEYQYRKAGQPAVDLSRLFVYFNARRMRGTADTDSGVSVPQGLAAFMAFGAPPESDWPYRPDLLTKVPDQAVYDAARAHVPGEYARVDGADHIRGALAQQFPVPFLFQVPERCYAEAGRTGVMPVPTAAEADAASRESGHAMLLVGYDLDAGAYLVRNSWGADWGDQGYCRIPFDAFELGVHPSSTWILGRLDATQAFTVDRPARAAAPAAATGSVADLAAKMREEIRSSLTKDIQDSMKDIRDRVRGDRR